MNSEMYDALIAAGAPEDKARAAAVSLAEESLATKADIQRIEKELAIIKWMLALVIVSTVIPFIRSLI